MMFGLFKNIDNNKIRRLEERIKHLESSLGKQIEINQEQIGINKEFQLSFDLVYSELLKKKNR
jgi:hypothetical protein